MSIELLVYMNSQRVGTLSKQRSGVLHFTYEQKWLEKEDTLPISLSLPLQDASFKGEVVYHYFDNLLPDNQTLRMRIQKKFKASSTECFELLSCIGKDCVGAIQLLSEPLKEKKYQTISADTLTDEQVANHLRNYQDAPLGIRMDTDFRISIAGAQEKTALLKYQEKWCLPHGTTPTTHIFKLPIGKIAHSGIDLSESVENEWLCLEILKNFNLPVNKAEIKQFEEIKVLVVERFDRKWAKDNSYIVRLPQEDMCQVFGVSPDLKYESDGGPDIVKIMNFLSGSEKANVDRINFFKTCFIFWVLGAIDGHAKNFSIRILEGGRFSLTPLYDVISAYPLVNKRQIESQRLKMAMSVKGKNRHYKWDEISLRHWQDMANACKISLQVYKDIQEEVFDNIDNVIEVVSASLPKAFPLQIATSIFDGIKKVKQKN